MAYLGILEGNARNYSSVIPRSIPRGTLASSRRRESIGPALLGEDLPQSVLNAAKAASNSAIAAAKAQGISGPGIAAAGKNAYDLAISAWRASLSTGTVTPQALETSPSAGTKTQDELRTYYSVPAPVVSEPAPAASNVPSNVTQEDLRSQAIAAPAAQAPEVSGKNFVVPALALAAAYFFLKG